MADEKILYTFECCGLLFSQRPCEHEPDLWEVVAEEPMSGERRLHCTHEGPVTKAQAAEMLMFMRGMKGDGRD